MLRWRLVDEQSNGRGPHVSTVVLSEQESIASLKAEAQLHLLAGWVVTEGDDVVVCRRPETGLVRTIRRVGFDAMSDSPGSLRLCAALLALPHPKGGYLADGVCIDCGRVHAS